MPKFPDDVLASRLFEAIERASVSEIEDVLQAAMQQGRGAVELLSVALPNQQDALHYAVAHKWRSVAVVNKLIDFGADVNARCGNFILTTPLHYTVGSGDMEVTQALLSARADPTIPFMNDTGEEKSNQRPQRRLPQPKREQPRRWGFRGV